MRYGRTTRPPNAPRASAWTASRSGSRRSSGRAIQGEKVEKSYDLVVMNPPFHQSRATEPGIGQAMIKAAASALKSGGQLLMVANRGLPYDQVLRTAFKDMQEQRNEGGFRMIAARR